MMRALTITSVILFLATLTGCYYFGPCIDGSGPVVSETREISGFSGVTNTGSFDIYIQPGEDFIVKVKANENLLPIIETYVSGYTLYVRTKDDACFRSSAPVEVYISMPELEVLTLSGSGRIFAEKAYTPVFECINSGSGQVVIDTVHSHDLTAGNSGSGLIRIGNVDATQVGFFQSGSGTIDGGMIHGTSELKIRHSSSGNVKAMIHGGRMVDGVLSGSGKIDLHGDAIMASFTLNASGRVDALEMMVEDAEAANTGSGNIWVYATHFLDVVITGSGDVIYRGSPALNYNITGSGRLRPY
jgi:hypothetical protein